VKGKKKNRLYEGKGEGSTRWVPKKKTDCGGNVPGRGFFSGEGFTVRKSRGSSKKTLNKEEPKKKKKKKLKGNGGLSLLLQGGEKLKEGRNHQKGHSLRRIGGRDRQG